MIEQNKINEYLEKVEKCKPLPWEIILDVNGLSEKEKIERSIKMACGQFNYWEENGKITWPNLSSEDWTDVVLGKRDIETMNLVQTRKQILKNTEDFISISNLTENIKDYNWWEALSYVFGGDPLRKRETLLWIMLTGLGFPIPFKIREGCIDYNVIVSLRYHGIVTGYIGNQFNILQETQLRYDCLHVIEKMLEMRKDLGINDLDAHLYLQGRNIRKTVDNWEDYFCYRFGCYFY